LTIKIEDREDEDPKARLFYGFLYYHYPFEMHFRNVGHSWNFAHDKAQGKVYHEPKHTLP
jgi:hypothetical protein